MLLRPMQFQLENSVQLGMALVNELFPPTIKEAIGIEVSVGLLRMPGGFQITFVNSEQDTEENRKFIRGALIQLVNLKELPNDA